MNKLMGGEIHYHTSSHTQVERLLENVKQQNETLNKKSKTARV